MTYVYVRVILQNVRNFNVRFLINWQEVSWTQDSNENNTLRLFRETTRELDNLYSVFPQFCGLSEPEYWSLLLIYEGVVTQSKISGQLFLSRQTLNSAFKQLVKKGLIVLEPFENNQRTKKAILTNAGRELVEKQVVYMHNIEKQAWKKLDDKEREMLAQLTRKYADVLSETLQALKEKN